MQLKNQKGSIAVEEVIISTMLVLALGGAFTYLSAGTDHSMIRTQQVYSGSHVQSQVGDLRPEFSLVSVTGSGSAIELETLTQSEPPSFPSGQEMALDLAEAEQIVDEVETFTASVEGYKKPGFVSLAETNQSDVN